ncbi:11417_t:CDS:1, partial [Racocetra fulgida]
MTVDIPNISVNPNIGVWKGQSVGNLTYTNCTVGRMSMAFNLVRYFPKEWVGNDKLIRSWVNKSDLSLLNSSIPVNSVYSTIVFGQWSNYNGKNGGCIRYGLAVTGPHPYANLSGTWAVKIIAAPEGNCNIWMTGEESYMITKISDDDPHPYKDSRSSMDLPYTRSYSQLAWSTGFPFE